MKKIVGVLIFLSIIIAAVFYLTPLGNNKKITFKQPPTAKLGNHSFSLFLARTDNEKQIGLSGNKTIKDNEGMLFTFEVPSYYSFWMKNMKFPIDMIFINGDKIVDIYQNLEVPKENEVPSIITPKTPADKVLEINAGLSKKYNFQKNDLVILKY